METPIEMNEHPGATAAPEEQTDYVVETNAEYTFPEVHTWDDLRLNDNILRSVYSYGFELPSDIQRKAILPIIAGHDLIAQAQSGTGKTGAFITGVLSRIDISSRTTQAIILAPTQLLAGQIHRVAANLSSFMDGIGIKTLVGGSSVQDDMHELRENPPHLVVGCAGRVYDMIRRRALNPRTVRICVLDEADEMLSAGFKDQINNIFRILPGDMQIALFSATMPPGVLELTRCFLRNPVRILMKNREISLEGIKQYYIAMYSDRDKLDSIKDLFSKISVGQTIIYANSVHRVRELYHNMQQDGYPVCCIHRDMSRDERKHILQEFQGGKYRVLISSDITARGIDVQQVNVVINYDIPYSVDTYLHRIGRSGRWGRKGVAINFVTKRDTRQMKNIEQHYEISMEEMPDNVGL